MRRFNLTLILAIFTLAGTAAAQTFSGQFPIDAGQPVPPNGSGATGTGMVTLNTTTNTLSWNIVFGGLGSPETAAHFHGPAPAGANAGIQVPLGIGSPKVGSTVVTPGDAADILAGLWYVNIHSNTFPAGEIRGQVLLAGPVPALPLPALITLGAFVLGAGGYLVRKRRN
jgi:hypothetical protein